MSIVVIIATAHDRLRCHGAPLRTCGETVAESSREPDAVFSRFCVAIYLAINLLYGLIYHQSNYNQLYYKKRSPHKEGTVLGLPFS